MRAVTVVPERKGSGELLEVPEPAPEEGSVLVETLAVGVDGTDNEIVEGAYGEAPQGKERLILGHESLGRVMEAPAGSGWEPGDHLVAFVRRPDPVPCPQCAANEWDMCTNGQYTEHGIKGLDGFLRERFRVPPDAAIKVDSSLGKHAVLIEPISVAAKAWDHVERIGSRSRWEPKKALVTGAGPLGLFAVMLGVQRGLEMHSLDVVDSGLKPELARALGATYHAGDLEKAGGHFDIVLDCTGVGPLVFHEIDHLAAGGIICLTGINPAGRTSPLNLDDLNKEMVLNNNVVFGSVNANRRHYEAAAEALSKADPAWLDRLVTRWERLEDWQAALERRDGDVKTVIRVSDDLEGS